MAVSFPSLRTPAYLVAGVATDVSASVYNGADKVHITEGTAKVYDAAGTQVGSMLTATVSGNVATVSVSPGSVDPARGWRIDWTLSDGTTYRFSQPAIVCRFPPACPVAHSDIVAEQPKVFGSGFAGQATGWQPQIDAAYAEVQATLLQSASVSVDQVTDPTVLYPLVLRLACVKVARIAMGPSDGKMAALVEKYESEYRDMLAMLAVQVDADGDGVADRSRVGSAAVWTVAGRDC